MKVSEVVRALELLAPPSLAADWDNIGLLVGDRAGRVTKLLLCVDLTEDVLAEAAGAKARMVMAYHPVIFKPVSRLTSDSAPVVCEALRQGISVYSMHTALDAAPGGTNDVLADAMGLDARAPLEPADGGENCKVVAFCPPDEVSQVAEAAFAAGAGVVENYRECAFFSHGIGAFCGAAGTRPAVGQPGSHEVVEEVRLEVLAPRGRVADVCTAIRAAHGYEEPAIDVYPLADFPEGAGAGRIGRLKRPVTVGTLIARIKKAAGVSRAFLAARPAPRGKSRGRPGAGTGALVSTAACSAGSAGGLWRSAAKAGATFYLTGEMRHHDALAAANAGLTVMCLGHSNSERIALPRLAVRIKKVLPKLQVAVSRRDGGPFEVV